MTHTRHSTHAHARPRSPTESSTFFCRYCLRMALLLWFDRIRGGLAPHKMAPSILGSLVLYFILMINDSWALGPWNMWKCLSKYARKCYGFPRAHLPFLPHNMARPPKNMFATALHVSPKKNVRKNRERHIIWQNHFPQY
jgi:hypothetical protein